LPVLLPPWFALSPASEAPADWMLNRVVEVDDEAEACRDMPLPNR